MSEGGICVEEFDKGEMSWGESWVEGEVVEGLEVGLEELLELWECAEGFFFEEDEGGELLVLYVLPLGLDFLEELLEVGGDPLFCHGWGLRRGWGLGGGKWVRNKN